MRPSWGWLAVVGCCTTHAHGTVQNIAGSRANLRARVSSQQHTLQMGSLAKAFQTSSGALSTELHQTNASSAKLFQGMFGLPPDYNCFARVFDQPRKIRLQCTKQQRRQMNCECTPFAVVSRQLTCDCSAPEANGHAEAEILRQFTDYRSVFPTKFT
eukprot:INCI20251.1.p1 GENE.INCI20251.1~~INCI20251.1.p1  ORF type:complete len:157 (-),score=18.98 INCI20251.1:1141-1611(-)